MFDKAWSNQDFANIQVPLKWNWAFSSWLSKITVKIVYYNSLHNCIQLFHNVNWTRTITNLLWPQMHYRLTNTKTITYIITNTSDQVSILDWLVNMVNSDLWLHCAIDCCYSLTLPHVQVNKIAIIHFKIVKSVTLYSHRASLHSGV